MRRVLMMKDIPVLKFDLNEGYYEILNEKFLPFTMKNKLVDTTKYSKQINISDLSKILMSNIKNISEFFGGRVLPLSRENAKKIYNLFGFNQIDDDVTKLNIAFTCRAISLQDNYWLQQENENLKWDNVNLRKKDLSEVVAQVSLHGTSFTVEGSFETPELTGQGMFAKAWRRESDGDLWLYKKGLNGEYHSRVEILVSNILDYTNVRHIQYKEGFDIEYICKCKCMTDDTISIMPMIDYARYCKNNNKDWFEESLKLDGDSIYKMLIVDYLISNPDRHSMNWGFEYNCNTMEILGCHPLFDHNAAFDDKVMFNDVINTKFGNKQWTLKESAKMAMNKVDFKLYKNFKINDFMNIDQYNAFMTKVSELGITVSKREDI